MRSTQKQYLKMTLMIITGAENSWNPWYTFDTYGLEASVNNSTAISEALEMIDVAEPLLCL